MTDILQMIRYAEGGQWPVGNGVLAQTKSFMEAWDFVRSERCVVAKERHG